MSLLVLCLLLCSPRSLSFSSRPGPYAQIRWQGEAETRFAFLQRLQPPSTPPSAAALPEAGALWQPSRGLRKIKNRNLFRTIEVRDLNTTPPSPVQARGPSCTPYARRVSRDSNDSQTNFVTRRLDLRARLAEDYATTRARATRLPWKFDKLADLIETFLFMDDDLNINFFLLKFDSANFRSHQSICVKFNRQIIAGQMLNLLIPGIHNFRSDKLEFEIGRDTSRFCRYFRSRADIFKTEVTFLRITLHSVKKQTKPNVKELFQFIFPTNIAIASPRAYW